MRGRSAALVKKLRAHGRRLGITTDVAIRMARRSMRVSLSMANSKFMSPHAEHIAAAVRLVPAKVLG